MPEPRTGPAWLLIETCKLNSVDPQAYLTNVLTKLVNLWPSTDRRVDAVSVGWRRQRRRTGRMTDAFTYAELDEILRGPGHSGAIGMSAIDGLIAALIAAPALFTPTNGYR